MKQSVPALQHIVIAGGCFLAVDYRQDVYFVRFFKAEKQRNASSEICVIRRGFICKFDR